ncbi:MULTISPECIES: hypothetical protein [unclassified Polaromonas]|uniref:hypothetical protein n=1 Tax=unclassified Polaromonas TaxID=2638319 RepID=UPI00129D8455|nr:MULTISPECIES: hypothetical protein [unclassified Polaromonas]QGJ18590.1 hypothetical protein F7R28_09420 [Polaromonas sp. Pch-P]
MTPLNAVQSPGTEVKGIPFRTKERYQATLYRLIDGSYHPVEAKDTVVTLANQEQLYLLGLNGSPLSDSTVSVALNPDNTLQSVSVDSKSKGEDALTELSSQAKAISDARDARDTAGKTALNTSEDARLAAMDAKKDAVLAQLALDTLSDSATLKDRTTAELTLARAKLVANQKARRAELPLPYPDAGL